MKRTATILLVAVMLAAGITLQGQQKAAKPAAKAAVPVKLPTPNSYLGNSDNRGGNITRDQFSSLMREGLTAHDSIGNNYKVVGFDFSYAEHKVYEDSIGNLIKVMDFTSLTCKGNMLPIELATDADLETDGPTIDAKYISAREAGDTVYFDRVKVMSDGRSGIAMMSDSIAIAAKGMKCVIVK